MAICFTQPIRHGGDRLQLAPLPPRLCLTHPLVLNLGMYNIQDGCGFGLTQATCAIKRGNYNLMLLTEIKILDAVYCHNHLRYDIF